MSYEAQVSNQRIDGTPPDRYFRCEVEVVKSGSTVVVARQKIAWRMRGPTVREAEVQNYVDRVKADLLSDVRQTDAFDPGAIT